jgi:hypothetical protein
MVPRPCPCHTMEWEAAGLSIRPSLRTGKKGGGVSLVVPHWGERLDEGGGGKPPALLSVANGFALTCSGVDWGERRLWLLFLGKAA